MVLLFLGMMIIANMFQKYFCVFPLFLIIPLHAQNFSGDSCRSLEVEEFYIVLNSSVVPLIIDTRIAGEFAKYRIPGAVLAESRSELNRTTDSLDRDRPIFLYCEYDERSQEACRILTERGFRNVYNLEGGLIAWRRAGYELDRKRIRRKRIR
jgi:rhodanese-related sulfurtransferase